MKKRIWMLLPAIIVNVAFLCGCATEKKQGSIIKPSSELSYSQLKNAESELADLSVTGKYKPELINEAPKINTGFAFRLSPLLYQNKEVVLLLSTRKDVEKTTELMYNEAKCDNIHIKAYTPGVRLIFTDESQFGTKDIVIAYGSSKLNNNVFFQWFHIQNKWVYFIDEFHYISVADIEGEAESEIYRYLTNNITVFVKEQNNGSETCDFPFFEDVLVALMSKEKCYIKNATDISFFEDGFIGLNNDFIVCQPSVLDLSKANFNIGKINLSARTIGVYIKENNYYLDIFAGENSLYKVKIESTPVYPNIIKFIKGYVGI